MTTFELTLQPTYVGEPQATRTITANCIHEGDAFVQFRDADHALVYAVARGVLLEVKRLDDEDQAADEPEPGDAELPPTHFVFRMDTRRVVEALARAERAAQRFRPNTFG